MPTIFNSNVNIGSVQIFVRTLQNKNLSIYLESTATVHELKDFIDRKYHIPIDTQQLFHLGRLLKDKRSLSTYKLNTTTTMSQPILLTQSFKVDVFISSKVLSLHSLTLKPKKKSNKKKLSKTDNKLPSQQSIQCSSTTTIKSLLKGLHLCHFSHLLKVCVGAGTEDIQEMSQRIIDIPNILTDGIVSILFSARWFLDRTVDIAKYSSAMSQTIQKSINSSKLLKSCISWKRLDYQFEKTQQFILGQFQILEKMQSDLYYEIRKASKWCQNMDGKGDINATKLLNQLRNKIESLSASVKVAEKKWEHKKSQIITYLQQTVQRTETELMQAYDTWNYSDIIQWLSYMDNRIVLSALTLKQFETANVAGYNLCNINDLTLKLMGIKEERMRQLIVGYINALILKYGSDDHSSLYSDHGMDDNHTDLEKNTCCICVRKEANTVIVPCGHSVYCSQCSKTSEKHSDRCPICRQSVNSIINIYPAGFNTL